jgi:hypothetical protein
MSVCSRRSLLIAASVVVVLILLAAFIVPALVNVNRYRSQVEARLQAETGKPVRIGHLALTFFPRASIRVDDFEMGNPKGFPQGDFLKAKRIYAVVNAKDLLNRKVTITSLDLENPELHLLSNLQGKWNYQNPPRPPEQPGRSPGHPLFTMGVVSSLRIEHGEWSMANLLPSGRPGPVYLEGQEISSQLNDVNLSVLGRNGAPSARAASARPAGFPLSFFSTAYAAEGPGQLAAKGSLAAGSLRFDTIGCTAFRSMIMIYATKIVLDDIGMDLDGGQAAGTLTLDFSGPNLRYVSDVQIRGVDVARLLNSFPQARGKLSGTMDGSMKLNGEVTHSPDLLAGLKGTGWVSVRNGKLPSLQLNRNLLLLARVARLGPAAGDPSSFSSISADLDIAEGSLRSRKISIVGDAVDVDGAGTMSLVGPDKLDYTGIAKLDAGRIGLTNILVGVLGATFNNGQLSFPFDLKGTLDDPRFILRAAAGGLGNLPNLLGRGANGSSTQNPAKGGSDFLKSLQGLFGKGKQPATQQQKP